MPPLAQGVDAFPRLEAGATAAVTAKINMALDKDEAQMRAALQQCFADAEGNGDWSRTVTVTMAGPYFLSLVARDSYSCGGPHPADGAFALVFSLKTGAPVNLAELLPGLKLKAVYDTAADGSKIQTITSPELKALYLRLRSKDPGTSCNEELESGYLLFIAWPESKSGNLILEPEDLPQAVAACGNDVALGIDILKSVQAAPVLLEALSARRQARSPADFPSPSGRSGNDGE